METDALIRSIALRDRHYMFFLGAGASVSSRIPTATDCIWNWKRSLFLTGNSQLDPRLLGDSSLPHVQRRIQTWLDQQGRHPSLADEREYSHFVEQCYPMPADRQEYFKALFARGQPHLGYHLLGILLEAAKIKWLWTVNFDDLVERGRPPTRSRPLLQVGMDTRDRLDRIRRESDDIVQVFLHGDYRYDHLRNTASELQSLDAKCRAKLQELCQQLPLVVIGYSGRDKNIMEALEAAYHLKGQGGLYWACMTGSEPAPSVKRLVEAARAAGNNADVFTFGGFDDFMARLARFWLKDTSSQGAVEALLATRPLVSVFSIDHLSPDFDWVLSNAYPITLPGELYQFTMKGIAEPGAWKQLKALVRNQPIVAGLLKRKVLALGRIQDIEQAFETVLDSKIEQISLAETDLTINNSIIRQIMLSGLVAALGARNLEQHGRYSLRSKEQVSHQYKQRTYHFSDAVDLSLDYVNGRPYLVTQPDISIRQLPGEEPLSKPEIKALTRDILWRQRNAEYMTAVKNWRRLLFDGPGWRIIFPPGAETGFEFVVGQDAPVCARKHSSSPVIGNPELAARFTKFERFKAFAVDEPLLRFAGQSRDNQPVKSIHPIRGLIDCGGPLESYQEALHSSRSIRLGVICLAGHERLLSDFLQGLTQPARVGKFDDADYVVDFPGFEAAFKCGLSIPPPKDGAAWKTIRDVTDTDPFVANRQATEAIGDCVRQIEAAGNVDVVVVYVPAKWAPFEHIVTDTVYLDLHDQVKAFCVQRHMRSQLIREAKVRNERSARIRWWLSLALFTKALRVPWMLDASEERVAYAGIGFAVDATQKDHRIVIGCSHLFNAAGIGMKFRLSELRDPIWKWELATGRKSPFMSRDDAYQLGVRTRQLFFEAHQDTPDRVVLCKRTPFLQTEVEGLLDRSRASNRWTS
jgi:hypothetical protein